MTIEVQILLSEGVIPDR